MSKSPSLRRIQADIRELALDPSDQYFAAPLEHDMFEWHFTIRGAEGTDFEGGIYHGRILLPAEYPYKPPHIMFLTPSGRFETNTKICLSFSAFHPELWQPAWGIRLILEALISFLPTPGDGAIGALDYSPEERRRLAKLSQTWSCPTCGPIAKLLPELDPEKKKSKSAFSKEIAELQRLQQTSEGRRKKGTAAEAKKADDDNASGSTRKNDDTKLSELAEATDDGEKAAASATTDSDIKNDPTTVEDEKEPIQQQQSNSNEGPASDLANESTAVEEEAAVNPVPADTLSQLYDPLMNISILIMICICILLLQKGLDLSRELAQLREMPLVEQGFAAGEAAASSVASVASVASEEL